MGLEYTRECLAFADERSRKRNSTQSGFNKNNIKQYGFTWNFLNHPNFWGSYWAGGSMVDRKVGW